ncbi:uncharacterized protein [Choristoneura fumiferana]|uniref:uncharacterized protein n=1 Tax=Choristoneura fumiferana TaxID=7141 RepID=UPI003D15BF5D
MLQKCCGSVELKAGALIIALMSVTKQLLACGAVGMIIYLVVTGRYISRVNLEDWSINVEMNDVEETIAGIVSVLLAPNFVFTLLLIVGILKESGGMMLPWLITSAIILLYFMYFTNYVVKNQPLSLIGFIPIFVLEWYFHLVVLSYYLEVRG